MPVRAAVAGHVECQFQPGPDSQFVEGCSQIVLYHLLAGMEHGSNVLVGQTLPHQGRYLNLFCAQSVTGLHGCTCSLINMAVASFTRFRPSLMPARKNSVRRCCFTVRGLMFKWLAISLLLHPCTSRCSTCWSRGVILISLRLIIGFLSAPSVQSWGRAPPTIGATRSPNILLRPFPTVTVTYVAPWASGAVRLAPFHESLPTLKSRFRNPGQLI